MTREEEVAAALSEVRERIADAAIRAGRAPASVRLIAVSKKMSPLDVRAALAAGQADFGESYAQELRDKRAALAGEAHPPRWHFLGPLQRNKVKYLTGQVTLIQSLDDADILAEIDRRFPVPPSDAVGGVDDAAADDDAGGSADEGRQACLVQVNVAGESRKGGVSPHRLPALLDRFATTKHGRCIGLMLIPPLSADADATRRHFATLRALAAREAAVSRPHVTLAELSMGMSGDFVAAVAEGATMVRVGTAIFGERPTS